MTTLTSTGRINWDSVRRFTPKLYYQYSIAPIWQLDSPYFGGESEYQNYWAQEANRMVITSKSILGKWQQNGKQAAKALELNQAASTPIFDFNGALALEPLPLAVSMVHEKVALLASNPPMPQFSAQQESQNQQVAALNQMTEMVFSAADFKSKAAKCLYDIQFWNAGCFKWDVDPFEPGLFAQPGKISLRKIAMDQIFPDPNCEDLHCEYMDYIVQKHTMEIGEIVSQYPLAANMVNPLQDELISDTSVTSRNNEDYIQSPQPKMARDAAGRRQKIDVLEAWIKDSRLKFEPEIQEGISDRYEDRFKLDKDGYIIGKWVKRYPNGRLIVVTGQTVLKDVPNPYPHGQFPYVFAQGMPSSTPWAVGNAQRIMIVTRKINNIISDLHQYFQSEIKRPMVTTPGAINDPNLAQQIPNDPTYVLELSGPAARLERRQAMDVPPSVYSYLQLLQGILDMTSGSSGLMRGQLQEGDQLSAEAVSNLQQFASSRLALEAAFFEVAVKQLGYQLMWLLRGIVKANITLTVDLPTGEQLKVDWKSDREIFERNDPTEIQQLRAKEDYTVGIKAGTGSPGAANQRQAAGQSLFNDGAIDRQAYLDQIQYPNRQAIVARMRGAELEDLTTQGIAKELGVNIKSALKQEDPGRRKKD